MALQVQSYTPFNKVATLAQERNRNIYNPEIPGALLLTEAQYDTIPDSDIFLHSSSFLNGVHTEDNFHRFPTPQDDAALRRLRHRIANETPSWAKRRSERRAGVVYSNRRGTAHYGLSPYAHPSSLASSGKILRDVAFRNAREWTWGPEVPKHPHRPLTGGGSLEGLRQKHIIELSNPLNALRSNGGIMDVPDSPPNLNIGLVQPSAYGISGLMPISKMLDKMGAAGMKDGVPPSMQLPEPVPSSSPPMGFPAPQFAKQGDFSKTPSSQNVDFSSGEMKDQKGAADFSKQGEKQSSFDTVDEQGFNSEIGKGRRRKYRRM